MREFGYVYIIENEHLRVKIGKTISLDKRIRTIETQSGNKINRVYTSPKCSNYSNIEASMHKIFSSKRLIGEWFDITFDEAVSELKKLNFEFEIEDYKLQDEAMQDFSFFLFSDKLKELELPKYDFNLDKWDCDEKDRLYIEGTIKSHVDFLIEIGEDATEYENLYRAIKDSRTLKNVKEKIQTYFLEIFYSVPEDMIEKCYDINTITYLNKILSPNIKYENAAIKELSNGRYSSLNDFITKSQVISKLH